MFTLCRGDLGLCILRKEVTIAEFDEIQTGKFKTGKASGLFVSKSNKKWIKKVRRQKVRFSFYQLFFKQSSNY